MPFSFFFNTIFFYVLKHLCEIAIQKAFLGGKVRSSQKKKLLKKETFFRSTHQENKTNTQATSKGAWAILTTFLRSMDHSPVLLSQLPPPKPPAEELPLLPLLCSTSCFVLKHNSASLPHRNALLNLRIKLFAAPDAGSIDVPAPHQAADWTQRVPHSNQTHVTWTFRQALMSGTLLSSLCIECFAWKCSRL